MRFPSFLARHLLLLAGLLVLASFIPLADQSTKPDTEHGFNALVYSRTTGFRHESIEAGITALKQLAVDHQFDLDATEDPSFFTDDNLADYEVIIFLNTTGDILNDEQQAAFERFIRSGRGFVGIHSAADTEYDWPFYGELVGAYFESHPAEQTGTVKVVDRHHPATSFLPRNWDRFDEWYNYQLNPRGTVHVLATLDERTYGGGNMGADHPIAWCQIYEGGRSWYTGGGHTIESFSEPLFREHLMQGIEYAAGQADGDCGASVWSNFDKVTLDDNTENPMALDIAPDGRVFFVERSGDLQIFDPSTNLTETAGTLDVITTNEDGLIGIALDPDFANNNWIYLFYSPANVEDVQYVSRFTLSGSTLDLSSEELIIEIPVQRAQCCHSGGAMDFDTDGNLFIATGDNTNPFESSGFAPIDERPDRSPWDAQKSSGNTNDLRGKILRITPQPDGTYTIPSDNLFSDPLDGRPEVYIMGLRNPFRFSIDEKRGWLYWGDVGPDAPSDNASRGPRGYDEWNQARAAGHYGWPYCIADNKPYRDYNFSTDASGAPFDCSAPVNDSPFNTGATTLPPSQPAWIWYPYSPALDFPDITQGGGRTAMAGPVYYADQQLISKTKLPDYYDDTLFIYEWARNWIHEVKLDDDGGILDIQPFLSDFEFLRPIDMKIGPDGAIYMLEWGTGFGGDNADSRLVRIEYVQGARAPSIIATAAPLSGKAPLTVQFDASRTFDPDPGEDVTFAWDFETDGTIDSSDPSPSHTYTVNGVYTAQLVATDPTGNASTANFQVVVGNSVPTVSILEPANGTFFEWGEPVSFSLNVEDEEDGSTETGGINCDDITLQLFIGHDEHTHPLDQISGCDGTFVASEEDHGGEGDRLFYVIEASYQDRGADGAGNLTGRAQHLLQPMRLEAEHYNEVNGVRLEDSQDIRGGGVHLAFIDDGDYVSIGPVNLQNIIAMTFRVASAGSGGRIAVRLGSPDGPELGRAYVGLTGGWQTFQDVTISVDDPGGTNELYLVFENAPGVTDLFNVNWVQFHGAGVKADASVHGLNAEYYPSRNFLGNPVERLDAQINYNWNEDEPLENFTPDEYSVRWTGFIVPEIGESYTFYTRSDDGMRVWLDGVQIINNWQVQAVNEVSSEAISLEAGRLYPVTVEYFEGGGQAQAHFLWSSNSTIKQPVPFLQLIPDATAIGGEPGEPPVTTLTVDALYPNPIRQTGTLVFELPESSNVRIKIFDSLGREVSKIHESLFGSGAHSVDLDVGQLASGVYFYVLETDTERLTEQFIVLK